MNRKLVAGLLIATMLPSTLPIVTLAEDHNTYNTEENTTLPEIGGGGF